MKTMSIYTRQIKFKNEIFTIDDGGVTCTSDARKDPEAKHGGAAAQNDHKNEGLC
jgi:hypothetical protein